MVNYATAARSCSWNLCNLATKARYTANAGGNSIVSEFLSVETLARLFTCVDIKTEMEISYKVYGSKIADYLITIAVETQNIRVGVSVARAMHHLDHSMFTDQEADRLMYKKLEGLIIARQATSRCDRYYASIVHFQAQSEFIAVKLRSAWDRLPAEIRDDIIVLVTVCDGSGFKCIYEECETCC